MRVACMFSGIGGIDLAFAQNNHKIVWANEINPYAAATYRKNFPDTDLVEDDIRNIDAENIPDFEILTAGFPCQSFSIMGYQRGFKDPRGNLFFEIARIIDAKRPKIVLLENVKNLVYHDNGRTFLAIYNTLAELGYYIKYKIMCPTEYADIPQSRKRIFLVAFSDIEACNRFDFPEMMPLRRKINDLIERSVRHSDIYYYKQGHKYHMELTRKIVDKESIYRIDDSGVAMRKYLICPTLKANMGTFPDRVPLFRDDFGIRKLTPAECLKLNGFSEAFKFPKIPLNEAYKQAGNTVCVPVVSRIVANL